MTHQEDGQAADALERAETLASIAASRGVYSRRAAIFTAIWAGAVAGLMVAESGWWFLLAVVGLIVYIAWQRNRAATLREVGTWRELAVAVGLVALLYGLVGLGFVGAAQGVPLAPILTGVAVALMLYATMHVAHHRAWARAA